MNAPSAQNHRFYLHHKITCAMDHKVFEPFWRKFLNKQMSSAAVLYKKKEEEENSS